MGVTSLEDLTQRVVYKVISGPVKTWSRNHGRSRGPARSSRRQQIISPRLLRRRRGVLPLDEEDRIRALPFWVLILSPRLRWIPRCR
jgi:hypothetical protein